MNERSAAEDATLERYETILNRIHDAVYTLDAEGRITWVNRTSIEEYDLGYSRDELIGSYVSKVLDHDDIEKAVTVIQNLLENDERETGRCEIVIRTADGNEIPCELFLSLLPFDDGEFQGTVGVLRDISEQRQREQRLAVFNRALRHNLRNDMSLILGQADTLQETLDGAELDKMTMIRERGERLVALAEKARDIEETLEGQDYVLTAVNVSELTRDRVTAIRDEYPAATVTVDAPEKEWALANETLGEAIDELVENAIEHNDEPYRVAISITTEVDDSEWVALTVEDNGTGIPQGEIDVLESGIETPMQHTTGLGLWFVHWLVDRYGGRLAFGRSEDGRNAVTIYLQPTDAAE